MSEKIKLTHEQQKEENFKLFLKKPETVRRAGYLIILDLVLKDFKDPSSPEVIRLKEAIAESPEALLILTTPPPQAKNTRTGREVGISKKGTLWLRYLGPNLREGTTIERNPHSSDIFDCFEENGETPETIFQSYHTQQRKVLRDLAAQEDLISYQKKLVDARKQANAK